MNKNITFTSTKPLEAIFADTPIEELPAPDFSGLSVAGKNAQYRFFRVREISEDSAKGYRLAMANVFSCLNKASCSLVYLLSGGPDGIALYLGVASGEEEGLPDQGRTLRAAFEGNFLGAQLETVSVDDPALSALLAESLDQNVRIGLISGVPTFNKEEQDKEEDTQGMERLVNSLLGEKSERWQLIVVALPAQDREVVETLEAIYDYSTALSVRVKQSFQHSENEGWQESENKGGSTQTSDGSNKSKQTGANRSGGESYTPSGGGRGSNSSRGTSESVTDGTTRSSTKGESWGLTTGKQGGVGNALTRERIDKRLEEIQKHLAENQIERFKRGLSKGMFRTAVYVVAPDRAFYNRLSRSVLAIFQGDQPSFTPLRVHKLKKERDTRRAHLLNLYSCRSHELTAESALAHSVPLTQDGGTYTAATWLTAGELALVAGLPGKELPGLKLRKSVDFALNTANAGEGRQITLGPIVQHGRELPQQVRISLKDLNKHVFITGVTGAGKTTTCMKLLLESGLPFLVIEPAKTEYRALHGQSKEEIDYYCLNREDLTVFRLNPFELVSRRENLVGHIDTLNAVLRAAFPMEAAIPQVVEEAIIAAYKKYGWDIHSGKNLYVDDPWKQKDEIVWPTFSDMIEALGPIIKAKGMGKEFEEKYQGTIVARLTNLTEGTKGRMLNTRRSLDFGALLDKRVVIELDEIKDGETKALLMGLVITRVAECVKQRHQRDENFQHLTLVEEAHRLLARPESGESGSLKMGVEMFANLLSEVRKYGEGLIIADQIPNKLVPDVIKNTHLKIVHRLFAADDRDAVGNAMSLSDEQKDFLPLLQTGETVIYSGGWHAPVRAKIDSRIDTGAGDIDEEEIRRRGRRQLWEQRAHLLPRLAQNPVLNEAGKLAEFVAEAPVWLYRLSALLLFLHDESRADRLYAGAKTHAQNLAEKNGVSLAELGTLLADALLDLSGAPELRPEDAPSWSEQMGKMLNALSESQAAFVALDNKNAGFTDRLRKLSI